MVTPRSQLTLALRQERESADAWEVYREPSPGQPLYTECLALENARPSSDLGHLLVANMPGAPSRLALPHRALTRAKRGVPYRARISAPATTLMTGGAYDGEARAGAGLPKPLGLPLLMAESRADLAARAAGQTQPSGATYRFPRRRLVATDASCWARRPTMPWAASLGRRGSEGPEREAGSPKRLPHGVKLGDR